MQALDLARRSGPVRDIVIPPCPELLTRLRDVEDERRVLIRLTSAGRKLKARAARIPGCVLEASQCRLSEAMALTHQIQALRDRLMA